MKTNARQHMSADASRDELNARRRARYAEQQGRTKQPDAGATIDVCSVSMYKREAYSI